MTAPILRIEFRKDKPGRYVIESSDARVVGVAVYEVFGRPYRLRFTRPNDYLTESPVAVDPTSHPWNSLKHILFTSRTVTLRTPPGEIVCNIEQRGYDPRKSRFLFRSADEFLLGAFDHDRRVFDRHLRPIARYESIGSWRPGWQVVDNDGAPIVKIRNGRVTTIEFLTPTTREVRLLMICTMLAVRVRSVYKPPDDGA
jgi:hypothetical protein